MTPFIAKTNDMINPNIPVPCGKCPNCVSRRVSGWSFRLMQEDKNSNSSHFITLTYDVENAPISKKGFLSLSKVHLQLFFKRLRKRTFDNWCKTYGGVGESLQARYRAFSAATKPVKYFAVGEYGSRTMRPHYHIILFNAKVELIQDAWAMGQVHYGSVSGASVGYTLKYVSKPGKVPLHKNDDRVPEFALMSKGLGKGYLTDAMIKWHKNDLDSRVYCNGEGGKKLSMPRYYKDKIYTERERKRVAFIGKNRVNKMLLEDKRTDHQKVQSDIAAFSKMKKNSQKGCSL